MTHYLRILKNTGCLLLLMCFGPACKAQIAKLSLKNTADSSCNCIYTPHPRYEGRAVRFSHYVFKGVKRKHMKYFADRPLKISRRYMINEGSLRNELAGWCNTAKYKLVEVKVTFTDFDDYFGVILVFEPKKR